MSSVSPSAVRAATARASRTRGGVRATLAGIRERLDDKLLFSVTALTIGGVLLVYSASFISAGRLGGFDEIGDPYKFLKTQSLYALCGVALMMGFCLIPARWFYRGARPALLIALGLLIYVLFFGVMLGGSRRWIQIGPYLFQPSEFAKIAIVLYLARFLADRWHQVRSLSMCVRALMVTSVVAVLVAVEPDLGGSVILLLIGIGMLFLAGARLWQLGLFGAGSAATAVLYASTHPYMKARIDGWLHPLDHVQGAGYHVIRMLVSLASGGPFGAGPGEGVEKCYLPARHTDSIYCVLGEEFGIIGCAALLVFLCIFATRALRIAKFAPNRFSQLAAGGLAVAVCVQALINLAVCTGCLPVTGTTLPFISGGGSSLIMVLVSAGIILSMSRLKPAARPRDGVS